MNNFGPLLSPLSAWDVMWTEFLVAFWIRKEESLSSMGKKRKKSIAWNWSERKGYTEQETQ